MTKSLFALVMAAASLASVSAQASEVPAFYGSVAVSHTHGSGDTTGFDSIDKNALGGSLALGASFSKYCGAEVVYQDFGSFDYSVMGVAGKARADAYGVQLVAAYPVTPKLSLVVKPGVLHTQADFSGASSSKTSFSLAAGAEYALTKQVALTGTVQRINNFADIDANLTTVTAGVKVNF